MKAKIFKMILASLVIASIFVSYPSHGIDATSASIVEKRLSDFTGENLDLPEIVQTVLASVSWPMNSEKPMKTYALNTGKIDTYDKNHKKESNHYINGKYDELYVLNIKDGWCKVKYPLDGGGRRKAYLPQSEITNGAMGELFRAKAGADTYKRNDLKEKAGNIDKGDTVWFIAESNNAKQVLYNIGSADNPSGYRLAWISNETYSRIHDDSTGNNYVSSGAEDVYRQASAHLGEKYGDFKGLGFHSHKWCADYVSWCAANAGQSKAIPWNAAVSGLWSAIKKAGGTEYSKEEIKNGNYTPVRGDIIIFKNDASHVGIVDYTSDGRIYYIDGNNVTYGNGDNSCVNYSDCSVSKKTFTCILKPNYR